MLIQVLKTKVAYAKITETNLYYVGSLTIDKDIMERANLRAGELIHVVNLANGERLETYVIEGERGTNVIGLNGPAARKGQVGDEIHILSYGLVNVSEPSPDPTIIDLRDES